MVMVTVMVTVTVRVWRGDVVPQADSQYINTQQVHTNYIISRL